MEKAIERIKTNNEILEELFKQIKDPADLIAFGISQDPVLMEKITEIQEKIEADLDTLYTDLDMDFAGESGRYYGYNWITTPEDAEMEFNYYAKYHPEYGLCSVII